MKNDALFVRLDSFRDRCRDALDFTRTVIQFSKLERIEIGGTKGKVPRMQESCGRSGILAKGSHFQRLATAASSLCPPRCCRTACLPFGRSS